MFDLNNIGTNQLDFFKELENIGASHAATALSVLLAHQVSIRVPRAQFCEYSHMCDILHGPENIVAGLLVGISGDLSGFILLVMEEGDAQKLTGMVLGGMVEGLSEADRNDMQISAMKEMANILIGSYITAISSLTGLVIDASVPDLVFDMAGAVLNLVAVVYGEIGDRILSMETEFIENSESLYGHFFLIPDIESYKTLLSKMEAF
jgi:chemotaxis protein CheC